MTHPTIGPPPETDSARWARADACPVPCGNLEVPRGIIGDEHDTSYVAVYRCADCGHAWHTGWVDN